jgi:hypothetical protein
MKVTMDVEKKSKKTPSKKRKKESSEIENKIKELRKEVAKEHKCRPFTILNEEDISQLISM